MRSGHHVISVRPLAPDESAVSAAIHQDVLGMEFLARFGPGFLRTYHRAWIESPGGLALAAVDADDAIVGVILASLDPAGHYRWMLTHAGPRLAARLVARSLREPALARDLIATRAARYAGAVWRQLTRRSRPAPVATARPRVGEVTHLMVRTEARGMGAGAALLAETERRAGAAGVKELVLVTPPELESRHFYEHLGWEATGSLTSRSGERFIRFCRHLDGSTGAAGAAGAVGAVGATATATAVASDPAGAEPDEKGPAVPGASR